MSTSDARLAQALARIDEATYDATLQAAAALRAGAKPAGGVAQVMANRRQERDTREARARDAS